jgi:hypothetical protein
VCETSSTQLIIGKCKSKPKWDITSHMLEALLQKYKKMTRVGRDVEKSVHFIVFLVSGIVS